MEVKKRKQNVSPTALFNVYLRASPTHVEQFHLGRFLLLMKEKINIQKYTNILNNIKYLNEEKKKRVTGLQLSMSYCASSSMNAA